MFQCQACNCARVAERSVPQLGVMIEPRFGCLPAVTQLWQLEMTGGDDKDDRPPARGLGQTCKIFGQRKHTYDPILFDEVRAVAMRINDNCFLCIRSR